jgi:hypothetical protein
MEQKEEPVSSRPHFADFNVPSSAGDCWEYDTPVLSVVTGVDQDHHEYYVKEVVIDENEETLGKRATKDCVGTAK